MEENKLYCAHCGARIDTDNYSEINGEIICTDCIERYCSTCDECGALIFDDEIYGDDYHVLCQNCYEEHYTRCANCDCLVHMNDVYSHDDNYYCESCFEEFTDNYIHDYGYKPDPIFYGEDGRYFGVELEIDVAGKDGDYAEHILDIGNDLDDCIYIKSDGSLNDGMEIVTHPMTLDYHKEYCWADILRKCIHLGYRHLLVDYTSMSIAAVLARHGKGRRKPSPAFSTL